MKTLRTRVSLLVFICSAFTHQVQATGPGEADFSAGIVALEGADPEGAALRLRKAAAAGHPGAMYQLGILHAQGYGVEKSVAECIRWHRAAAEAGYANAMYDLGLRHARGTGLPLDHAEKFRWWRLATEAGHPVAPHEIALAHAKGEGVPASDSDALRWFERGAALGNADSMATLGWYYAEGKGVPADPVKAHAWHLKAAQNGQVAAMFAVGFNFDRGVGIAQNDPQAVHWYGRAARQNHPEAVKNLAAMRAAGRDQPVTRADQKPRGQTPAPATKSVPVPRPATAVASAQSPAPTPAATPAAAPTRPAPQLSDATRDATNWEEFFAASARRTAVAHRHHDPDVKLFLDKNPATAEQLRIAYRRARDGLRPTPGTVRGREFGAQFVAYHLAILATGLSGQAAADFVRDDFQALARRDVQNAQQVLMGVDRANIPLFRPFLTPQQSQQVRDLADLVLKRQPLPTVPEAPAPADDPAKAAAALYAGLTAKLDAREKGAAFTPDEEKALEELSRLLPLAAKQSDDAYSRRINERIQAEPGAADVFAGNAAWRDKKAAEAFRLLQQAAAAGNSHAKINLAGWFATDVAGVPSLAVERRKALVLEAHAAGNPGAPAAFINLLVEQRSPDLDEIAKWAKAAVGQNHPKGAYFVYFTLLRQRLALARDPLRALEATKPEIVRAHREELDAALALLRAAAARGRGDAMFELARYHQHGGLPGLRPTFAIQRPEHNLSLARFWFSRALEVGAKDINETNLAAARKAVTEIDATLALAKGRPWKADEVVAALDAGIPHDHVSWLLTREDATFTKSEHTRILTSEAGRKLEEYGMLLTQLGFMVQTGPGDEAAELAAAAITERRRSVAPLPQPGDGLAALRRRHEAGDPAAAYALLRALSSPDRLVWPDDMPPRQQLITAALSVDHAPAAYLRADTEGLVHNADRLKRDLPRGFALTLASARAGSAEAARRVADFYRGSSGDNAVRPNFAEAEWWYAQAAALAWPGELSGGTVILDPERTLARLYAFERAGLGMGIAFNARDPAVHRWARELRRRGGAAKTLADEKVAYYGTADAGNHKLEPLIAALPPELPPFAPGELARLEGEAAAGRVPALIALARALAFGERGLRQDDARAVALYRRAAEAGSTDAMGALAEHLREGYGVRRDFREALAWQDRAEGKARPPAELLIEAARLAALKHDTHALVEPYLREAITLGDATAMQTLASHLTAGRVVKKDVEEGLRLLHRAAEAGNVSAMTGLGLRYRTGDGVPADPEAGHRWRVRAAEAGDKNSIQALVDDHDRGRNGAPQDARAALRWAQLAAVDSPSLRTAVIPRLEREVAALDRTPGATTQSVRREALARQSQVIVAATIAQAAIEAAAVFDPAPIHAAIAERGDFQMVSAPGRALSQNPDQPLEATFPRLQSALSEARGDPQRLRRSIDDLVTRHPDRAEPLIARAQVASGLPDQQELVRTSIESALKIDPFHPQAHNLLARLDVAAGQRERAFRRMAEMAALRPRSIQIATTEAELLILLEAQPAARVALRKRIAPLLGAASPPERFAALIASAKLAAGMNDLEAAATDLDAALDLNRDPRLLLERAGLRERMGNHFGAWADLRDVLDSPLGRDPLIAEPIRQRLTQHEAAEGEAGKKREELARIAGAEKHAGLDAKSKASVALAFSGWDFNAGVRAHEAGDIEKARALWTKAAAAGHQEAAERLKSLPPAQP